MAGTYSFYIRKEIIIFSFSSLIRISLTRCHKCIFCPSTICGASIPFIVKNKMADLFNGLILKVRCQSWFLPVTKYNDHIQLFMCKVCTFRIKWKVYTSLSVHTLDMFEWKCSRWVPIENVASLDKIMKLN